MGHVTSALMRHIIASELRNMRITYFVYCVWAYIHRVSEVYIDVRFGAFTGEEFVHCVSCCIYPQTAFKRMKQHRAKSKSQEDVQILGLTSLVCVCMLQR